MFVCVYVHMYVCMYVCMYICMYVCTYVHMYVCTYVCMYANYILTLSMYVIWLLMLSLQAVVLTSYSYVASVSGIVCMLINIVNVCVVCGREFDRLSYGILWPIIEANQIARMFCSDINPLFGFGPYATRRCRENGTWERVDTSQCSIRPTQRHVIIILYSTYAMFNESAVTSSPEIEQVRLSLF